MTQARAFVQSRVVDVDDILANRSLSRLTVALTVLLALVLITDGFDIVVLGYLAPAISAEFGLSSLAMGWFITSAHVGVAFGGVAGGLAGDRYGRRILLIVSVAGFGAGTLAGAMMDTPAAFIGARFVASICMGAAAPNVATYLVEILPARWNSRLSVLAYAAYSLGSVLCGLAARTLLPIADWRIVFVLGGAVPLVLLLPVLLWVLPESPRFLVKAGRSREQIAGTLARLCGGQAGFSGNDEFTSTSALTSAATADWRSLLPEHGRSVILLSLMALLLYLASIGLSSMGTLILTALGLSLPEAVSVMLAQSLAGLAGALLAAFTIFRFGSRATVTGLLACSTLCLGLLAYLASGAAIGGTRTLAGLFALTGFGLTSSLMILFPLSAQAFPTEVRSTLTGTVASVGRIGSIMSSAVVAMLLAAGGPALVFVSLGLTAAAAIAAAMGFDRHIPARRKSAGERRLSVEELRR